MLNGVHSMYEGCPTYTGKGAINNVKGENPSQTSAITTVSWGEILAGTAPSASFVVCNSPEDKAAMQEWFSNCFSCSSGLSSEDSEPTADLSTVLTDEEWKSLNQKYDPSSMTRQEYDALLKELYQMGLLSQEELNMLFVCEDGHSSCMNVGGIHLSAVSPELLGGHCITSLTNNSDFPDGQPTGFSSGKAYSDVFAMSAWEKTFQYYDQERSQWLSTRKAQAFQRLDAILQEMVSHK